MTMDVLLYALDGHVAALRRAAAAHELVARGAGGEADLFLGASAGLAAAADQLEAMLREHRGSRAGG